MKYNSQVTSINNSPKIKFEFYFNLSKERKSAPLAVKSGFVHDLFLVFVALDEVFVSLAGNAKLVNVWNRDGGRRNHDCRSIHFVLLS